MTMSTKLVFITTVVLTFWFNISQAYCIYNHLDGENSHLYIYETKANSRVSFKKQINNGEKECCPWDNRECNTTGRRDGIVDFHAKIGLFGGNIDDSETYFIFCSGGGGLVLTGNHRFNITQTCNQADGNRNSRIVGVVE